MSKQRKTTKKETELNKEKMNNKNVGTKLAKKKALMLVVAICVLIYIVYAIYLLIKQPTNIFTIEEGKLYQEETSVGYIIRDEKVAKGENYKNGMEQIIPEGERASVNENIFRYYSANEENLKQKIAELDLKIQEAMKEDTGLLTSDMKLLEDQIEEKIANINQITDVNKLAEYKKEIDDLVLKKARTAGSASPQGSYLNNLIAERKG